MVGIVTLNFSGNLASNDDSNDDSSSSDSSGVNKDDNDDADDDDNGITMSTMNGARTGLGRRIYERKQRWDATPATAGGHETSTQPENRDPSLAVAPYNCYIAA